MATLPVPGRDGVRNVPEDQLSKRERSILGAYYNAVQRVLGNQDPWAAVEFEGVSIGGVPLPTDPDEIEWLAFAGEFDFDDFYTLDPGEQR
jgi:hypothetical protein